MPRQRRTVAVGPWPGGMNTKDDPRLLPDTEAAWIVNWDVEDNGALVPRRGWYQADTGYAKAWPLCIYVASNDNSRAICSLEVDSTAGAESSKFFYTAGPVPSVFMIKNQASAEIQRDGRFVTGFLYNGKIYFVPHNMSGEAAGVGFRKSDTSFGGAGDDPVDVASMPGGRYSWVMNDRAFIFNPRSGRLYWSKATDADTWLTSGSGTAGVDEGGYVDIDPNDNPFLDCVVVHDTVYFIRMDRIYTFRFSSDPSLDGQISQIANSEGAIAGTSYNNQLVLVTPKGLFYFQNGYFTLITDKVNFTDAQGELMTQYEFNEVAVIGHTLITRFLIATVQSPVQDLSRDYYRSYAVNMRTGAISEYANNDFDFLTPYGKMITDGKWSYSMAKVGDTATTEHAYVIAIPHERDYYRNVGGKEDYYTIRTKLYDFGQTRSTWKRMRTATIDYDIDFDRTNKDVQLDFLHEVDSSAYERTQTVTLTNDRVGRVATPNFRFRRLEFIITAEGGAVNSNDAAIVLRQLLCLISVGEFEEFKAE